MKNWPKISFLSLVFAGQALNANVPLLIYAATAPFAPFIAANTASAYRSVMNFGQNFEPNLDNLNVFTLIPTHEKSESTPLKPVEVCQIIKDGHRLELEGRHVAINDKQYKLSCDIPKDCESIVVHNAGYDGYVGSAPIKFAWAGREATNLLKNNLIPDNTPVVCFEGPVNYPSTFSFGGEFDQKCLDFVYGQTRQNNPKASIILSGDCKGATGVLNYLSNRQYTDNGRLDSVKAAILESPSSSLAPFADNVAKNHVPAGLRWLIPLIFKGAFHNCKWDQPTILDKANDVPNHVKVHVGYLKGDKAANPRDAAAIVQALIAAGKNVESFEHTDTSLGHGHLGQSKGYQKSVREFLDTIVKK
jgi:hypothetical protein